MKTGLHTNKRKEQNREQEKNFISMILTWLEVAKMHCRFESEKAIPG